MNCSTKKVCYITTPIFYPSGKPHIGHAFTTILGDFLKRFKIQSGYEAFFLTGTDEHGKKIAEKALQNNCDPQTFVDQNSAVFKNLFDRLQIQFDAFERTTNAHHVKVVQDVFSSLQAKGYIYPGDWSGLYCVDCEENYTSTQAVKNEAGQLVCRIGHNLQELKEKSYFIKVSDYVDWIKQVLSQNQINIFPQSRINELLNNFVNTGLKDLSITRESVSWGISVPNDSQQTVYVWFDALFGYLSGLNFKHSDDANYQKFWNNQNAERIHLLSKEITRFHCIYWPIFLKMLNLNLPTKLLCHGWIVDEQGNKMSKSLNNVIDPNEWIDKYGVDAIRYFLLKEMVLDQDNRCGENLLISTVNNDLANNFGNLVSRTIGMLKKYQNRVILPFNNFDSTESEIACQIKELRDVWNTKINEYKFKDAFTSCLNLVLKINKLIEDKKPWVLFSENKTQELSNVLYLASATIRTVFVLLSPVLINKSNEVFNQMNFDVSLTTLTSLDDFDAIANIQVNESCPLFARIDNNLNK